MSYKEQPTDARVAKDHEEHFPQPFVWHVQLVREDFEEGDVEEGSTSNTLEKAIADILGQAGGKVSHGNANTDTNGTCNAEHDVRDDKALDRKVGLGDVEAKTEGHDCLVDDDSDEDRDELG